MPEIQVKTHNTRVSLYYRNFPYVNKQFSNSFYPYFTKKWNSSQKSLQYERDINEFKLDYKNVNESPKYKFYFRGSTKRGCSLLTQLRIGHAFPLGLSLSPKCLCHAPRESPGHMLLKCFMYYKERLTLLSKVENLLPKFKNFTEKKQLQVLLFGLFPDNPDYYQINKSLQIAVQQFLLSTKRFDCQ